MLEIEYLISIFWRGVEMLQTAFLNDICELADLFFASHAANRVDLEVRHFEGNV